MKKTSGAAAIVLILAAAYAGASWYVGKQAQTVIQDTVENANKRLSAVLGSQGQFQAAIRFDRYERGVFSSVADYSLELRDKEGQVLDLRLQDKLDHGPFPWSLVKAGQFEPLMAFSQAKMMESPATRSWVQSQKDGRSPVSIQTKVAFGGTGTSLWNFLPVTITGADGVIGFSGGSLDMQFSRQPGNASVKGQFANLVLSGRAPGKNLQVSGVSLNAESTSGEQGAVGSRSQLNVERLVSDDPDIDGDIVVTGLRMGFKSQQSGNLLNANVLYDLGSVAVGTIKLGSMSLGAGIERADMAALSALIDDYDAIQAKHQDADPAGFSAEEQQALNQRLLVVLAAEPRVSVDPILWKNEKGQSNASLHVRFRQPVAAAGASVDTLLLQSLGQTDLDITVSRAMLLQAAAQMQSNPDDAHDVQQFVGQMFDQYVSGLQEAGLVSVDGDQAQVAVTYTDQKVDLNGRVMPVEQFMQLIFGSLLMM